jgi:4,5-DOPA dioxygenase extradiol
LGRALRPLRDEGILVAASGGIVHNLRRVHFAGKDAAVDGWAARFDAWVAERAASGNFDELFAYRELAPDADWAAPTSEHFDPLFVTLGAAFPEEPVQTIFEGFQYGNLSMRSFSFEAGGGGQRRSQSAN